MNRILLLKGKVKKYEELFYELRNDMNTAKFRWETAKKELEKEEAEFICDSCKGPIKKGEPYILDRQYKYCSRDCKSTADVKEIYDLEQLESDRQNGKL